MRRYKHNLSHYHLFTGNMGDLIPAACVEVLPGDSFQGQTSLLVRATPLVAPVMHPVTVRVHHWFVPNRILWGGWENWIVNSTNSDVPPTTSTGINQPLNAYLGLDDTVAHPLINALPHYAYNKIWNECYRDKELCAERAASSKSVAKVMWEKDEFTTASIDPAEGAYDVKIPLDATSQTMEVADLRAALADYRYQEARSRYGTRYVEYLRYLGIKPSDARYNRPEFLGGGRQTISFSEVLQTGEGTDPVGTMRGHGIVALRSNRYRRFFEEHGFVMTLVSVRPKSIYQTHFPRRFMRLLKEDYWQKERADLGLVDIEKRELFSDNTVTDTETFGYQDRDFEYRRERSRVSGEFLTTQNHWHLARLFASHPELNESFITCDPSKRIFADQTSHGLYFMAQNQIRARRLVKDTKRVVSVTR